MDIWDKEKRSAVMAKIKSKDTKPELLVRRYLYHRGYRYRKNVKGLPGTPDIVMKKYGIAIFVHGCFWHGHDAEPSRNKQRLLGEKDFTKQSTRRGKQRGIETHGLESDDDMGMPIETRRARENAP